MGEQRRRADHAGPLGTTADTPRLLQRQWEGFVRAVLIADAPAHQLREMRRAFFAGARAYSALVMRHAAGGDAATPGDLALMEALEAEMAAFLVDVETGKA